MLRDQGPLAFQRSKCISPKIRHLLGIPKPSPTSKALGSLTLRLLAVGMTETSRKTGVLSVTGS